MSRCVNQVTLLGYVGKDPLTKFTPTGKSKTSFSVATNRSWKDKETGEWKEETDWHNVVSWGQDNLQNYLTKGKQVLVQGRIQTRSWDDRDSGQKRYITEIVADTVIMTGPRPQEDGDRPAERSLASAPASSRRPQAPADFSSFEVSDDDVPF